MLNTQVHNFAVVFLKGKDCLDGERWYRGFEHGGREIKGLLGRER